MDDFLQNNKVIRSSPTRQKAALVRANNIIKDGSETLNQDFSNDFIDNVAQTNGPEVFVSIWRIHLRNERNERV